MTYGHCLHAVTYFLVPAEKAVQKGLGDVNIITVAGLLLFFIIWLRHSEG